MADQYGLFWNSNNNDRLYSADSFSELFQKFFTTGVFQNDLQVTATSGMDIQAGTGYACINGKVRFFDTVDTLTVPPASGTYPRIDTVVIERNDTNREITIKLVTGEYSGTEPTATAPVRSGAIYQIVLAEIYVGVGVTEITAGDITDKRPDSSVCGWVISTVQELDISQILAQNDAQFQAWFESMKDQLSTDAAGHLQNEIDTLNANVTALYPTETDITLSAAGWSNDTYTINDVSIDPDKTIFLTYPATLTDAQFEAYVSAQIRPYGAVTSGSMTLKAVGGAPAIDLPLVLIVRE